MKKFLEIVTYNWPMRVLGVSVLIQMVLLARQVAINGVSHNETLITGLCAAITFFCFVNSYSNVAWIIKNRKKGIKMAADHAAKYPHFNPEEHNRIYKELKYLEKLRPDWPEYRVREDDNK